MSVGWNTTSFWIERSTTVTVRLPGRQQRGADQRLEVLAGLRGADTW